MKIFSLRAVMVWLALAMLTSVGVGCGDDGEGTRPVKERVEMPSAVRVQINGIAVSPVKANGCQWDGPFCEKIDGQMQAILQGVTQSLATNSGLPIDTTDFSRAIAPLFESQWQSLALPDPFALVEYWSRDGGRQAGWSPKCNNTLECVFTPTMNLFVPWADYDSIVLQVFDEDFLEHDEIGSIIISRMLLEEAYQLTHDTQQPVWISQQSNLLGGVLGVSITVTPIETTPEDEFPDGGNNDNKLTPEMVNQFFDELCVRAEAICETTVGVTAPTSLVDFCEELEFVANEVNVDLAGSLDERECALAELQLHLCVWELEECADLSAWWDETGDQCSAEVTVVIEKCF